MKNIYLLLAVLGAVIPMVFFYNFLSESSILAFIPALFVNGAAGGFSADLLISSVVFWIFMFTSKKSGPSPWWFVALNLCIGLSCALPAYCYWQERSKQDTQAQ